MELSQNEAQAAMNMYVWPNRSLHLHVAHWSVEDDVFCHRKGKQKHSGNLISFNYSPRM